MYSTEAGRDVFKAYGMLFPACSCYLSRGFYIFVLCAPNLATSILPGLSTDRLYPFPDEVKHPTLFYISTTCFNKKSWKAPCEPTRPNRDSLVE